MTDARTTPISAAGEGVEAGPSGSGSPNRRAFDLGPDGRRLLARLRPEVAGLGYVALLTVGSISFTVIGPRLLGAGTNLIVDGLRTAHGVDFSALGRLLLWTVALYCLASVFAWHQAYLLNRITMRTVFRLRRDVEDKVHRLPLKYFDTMPRGDLLSRVTNDIDNIQQTLEQTVSQAITAVLTVLGVLIMMFWISPLLALVTLLVVPITLVVTRTIARRSQKLFVAQWQSIGELNTRIEETFTAHSTVMAFGRQREVNQQFAVQNQQLYESSFGAQFVSGLIVPAMTLVGNLVYVVIACVGGLQVVSGGLRIGDAQAFIQYAGQFTQPISQLGAMANLLQSGIASAARVFQLLDSDEQTSDPARPREPRVTRGRVTFDDVSFSYRPDQPLIEHLSLVAEPGQAVAIVGPTGAGKTTLVNLMVRFYDPDAGRITLDGVDIAELSRADLRGRIGMVLQDTWLFAGTIRDNISYGRPGATEDEIIAAASATYVDRFVRSLPDGYDTLVDDEGANVSAGEKQLITIARAFLSRPSVLILDEATSSVDTRTELLVQKAMSALREGRTSFVIAHRLSTIRDADLILVMDAGHIVEQGTHPQLLARGGPYHALYNAQFRGALTDGV